MVKNKKLSLFWKIFIPIVIAVFAAVNIALVWFRGFLADYEDAQPKHVAADVFNTYFSPFDSEKYLELCADSVCEFETADDIVEYLKGITNGQELSYNRVTTGIDGTYKYVVKAGDTKFASFSLVADSGKSGRFKKYKPDSYELYVSAKMKKKVEIPKGYLLFVNSKLVGDEYITKNDIETDSCSHMPEGVSGTYYTRYVVKGLLNEPQISVTDASGEAAETETLANGTVRAAVVSDKALAEEQTAYVTEAAEKYAVYMQFDSQNAAMYFSSISKYFDPSSELYESVRTVENGFVIEYDSYDFENVKCSEFVKYNDATFSCRVSFTQVLHRRGAEDYKDYLDLTLYFRDVNGKYLIYDMGSNA